MTPDEAREIVRAAAKKLEAELGEPCAMAVIGTSSDVGSFLLASTNTPKPLVVEAMHFLADDLAQAIGQRD